MDTRLGEVSYRDASLSETDTPVMLNNAGGAGGEAPLRRLLHGRRRLASL